MPTYEYECKKCGHRFEVFQSMSDEPVKKCPECGKEVRRLVSGGLGVIFKGSGFYVTDKDKSTKGSCPKEGVCPKADDCHKVDTVSKNDSTPKGAAESKPDTVSKGDGSAKSDGASKEGGAKGKAKPAA